MKLSILVPSNTEMFLKNTVEDILKNIEDDTEIIVTLDGKWADPPLAQHERVNVIYVPVSVGQRAATNIAARLAKGKYLMKVDAHCSFDKGFDRKMLEAFKKTGDNVTMVPIMRNLWAFDWKCYKCGKRTYQGPTPKKCVACGRTHRLRRKLIWVGKHNPQSTSFCFDSEPHFQYFEDYKHRPQYIKDKTESGITETLSLQGSAFMCTKENYWKLKLCDEDVGSWGNQGIELACKTWLSGGRVLVNHNTWYAHMFRTQGGDFGFPYEQRGKKVSQTKQAIKDMVWNGKLPHQTHPLKWLLKKFWPIKDWTQEQLDKLPSTL